jgi:hypothetical protein
MQKILPLYPSTRWDAPPLKEVLPDLADPELKFQLSLDFGTLIELSVQCYFE